MTASPPRLFCFGLGYSAAALADSVRAEGWQVAGTCRSAARAGARAADGIDAYRFDRSHPLENAAAALAGATHVLVSVPPDQAGDPVLDLHEADLAAIESVEWVGYLSSTSVYGDRRGGWVDETSAPAPRGAASLARVAAEDAWLDVWHRYGLPVHLFRLAGIYGPGRSAIDQLRTGTARRVDKPGHLFNRIHVDDIVQVLRASMAQPNAGAIYNLCDDEPAPAAAVVEHACRLLGVAPPPLVPWEQAGLRPAALEFYAESRRVRNERIKRELGVTLRHPDYRRGLAACLTGGRPS